MNYESMRKLLKATPFHPFELITSAGEVHLVAHPEFAALAKSKVVVISPETDDFSVIPLLRITESRFSSTEKLEPQSSLASFGISSFSSGELTE